MTIGRTLIAAAALALAFGGCEGDGSDRPTPAAAATRGEGTSRAAADVPLAAAAHRPSSADPAPSEVAAVVEHRLEQALTERHRVHTAPTAAAEDGAASDDPGDPFESHRSDGRGHDRGRGGRDDAPGITVRGGYVNDVSCIPLGGGPSGEGYEVECTGGSWWNGDFTGRAVVYWKGYVSPKIEIDSAYDETFVGTYAGDESTGGLRLRGRFTLDENGAFSARADIVGASCAWAGSTGSIAYDGYQANGGYIGNWVRPEPATASDPACDPMMLPFDPVGRLAPAGR